MLVVCEISRPTDYAPSEIWQMQSTQELVCVLKDYFIDNQARLNFIASYLLALIKTRSVNGTMLAGAFTGRASSESVYRRIQRFFAECYFSDNHLAAIVLLLARKQEYRGRMGFILCIDRTIWQIGSLALRAGQYLDGISSARRYVLSFGLDIVAETRQFFHRRTHGVDAACSCGTAQRVHPLFDRRP